MTFRDVIIVPLQGMVDQVAAFIPPLLSVFVILVLGLIFTKLIHYVVVRLFKQFKINKIADRTGLSGVLKKGGIKHSFGDLVGSLVYVVLMVIFVLIAVKTAGLPGVSDYLGRIFGYVPHVFTAVLILTLGHILAKLVSTVVHMVAGMMDLPKPKLLERISRWAIIIYAVTLAIEELGYSSLFVGTPFYILVGGLALAIGLGLKDHVYRFFDRK